MEMPRRILSSKYLRVIRFDVQIVYLSESYFSLNIYGAYFMRRFYKNPKRQGSESSGLVKTQRFGESDGLRVNMVCC